MSFDYPLSKQDSFVSNLDRLREIAPDVATAFRGVARRGRRRSDRSTPSSASSPC